MGDGRKVFLNIWSYVALLCTGGGNYWRSGIGLSPGFVFIGEGSTGLTR